MRQCKIEDCNKKHLAKGWCNMHYHRWRRGGTTNMLPGQRTRTPLLQRLMSRTKTNENGCYIWTGPHTKRRKRPYGTFSVLMYGKIKTQYVHRWVWLLECDDIPPNHCVHHICNESLCINPEHLECMTREEHIRKHGRIPHGDRLRRSKGRRVRNQ